MGVFITVALYNAVELIILILFTFRRYNGLYFWSMLVSCVLGIIPTTIGNLLHFFALSRLSVALALSHIGFYFMVPGQSIVLYSRLHLVYYSVKGLRAIRFLIISDAAILVPTSITTFGTAFIRTAKWNASYQVMERLELTWFCCQELLISSIYIWETIKLLQLIPEKASCRKIMHELVIINLAIILMDIAILVLEYMGLYYIQVNLKSVIYSIKLKLEFAVLGKLVAIVSLRQHEPSCYQGGPFPEHIHPSYVTPDDNHAKSQGERIEWPSRLGIGDDGIYTHSSGALRPEISVATSSSAGRVEDAV